MCSQQVITKAEQKGSKMSPKECNEVGGGCEYTFTSRDLTRSGVCFVLEEDEIVGVKVVSGRLKEAVNFDSEDIFTKKSLPSIFKGKFTVSELKFVCNALRERLFPRKPDDDWWNYFEKRTIQNLFVRENRVGWIDYKQRVQKDLEEDTFQGEVPFFDDDV